jgi:uncharacterized damage-inducible protein DinB
VTGLPAGFYWASRGEVPFFPELAADDGSDAVEPAYRVAAPIASFDHVTVRTAPRLPLGPRTRLSRAMAFNGVFVAPEDDPRRDVEEAGELATYRSYLENGRLTLELKCQGLSPAQLAAHSVPPSDLSLLGLVRHMSRVEHYWFSMVIDQNLAIERLDAADPTGGFHSIEPTAESVEEAFERWRVWREYADDALDRLREVDLGERRRDRHGNDLTLRDILVHLVEEYARHCGHADLLRECIDGRTGI